MISANLTVWKCHNYIKVCRCTYSQGVTLSVCIILLVVAKSCISVLLCACVPVSKKEGGKVRVTDCVRKIYVQSTTVLWNRNVEAQLGNRTFIRNSLCRQSSCSHRVKWNKAHLSKSGIICRGWNFEHLYTPLLNLTLWCSAVEFMPVEYSFSCKGAKISDWCSLMPSAFLQRTLFSFPL